MSKIAIKQNNNIIEAGDMSADIESEALNLNSVEGYSVQFIWSGTSPVGSVKLMGSNLEDPDTFIDIDGATVAVSGNTGKIMIEEDVHSYKWVKAAYVFTSGVGTLTATIATRSRK